MGRLRAQARLPDSGIWAVFARGLAREATRGERSAVRPADGSRMTSSDGALLASRASLRGYVRRLALITARNPQERVKPFGSRLKQSGPAGF
jgi:hypothetical protein